MTPGERLLTQLRRCAALARRDPEEAHVLADKALLRFVDDKEVTDAFTAIFKWYA